MMTNVFIIDSCRVVVEGIRSALQKDAKIKVAGEADALWGALSPIGRLAPDIVIADVPSPQPGGPGFVRRIRDVSPQSRVIAFTFNAFMDQLPDFLRRGVSGVVLKEDPLDELVKAVQTVRKGDLYVSQTARPMLRKYLKKAPETDPMAIRHNGLGDRERDVFRLLAEGIPIVEIARILGISPKTVESQKYRVMEKLFARTLTDLTRIAVRRELIRL